MKSTDLPFKSIVFIKKNIFLFFLLTLSFLSISRLSNNLKHNITKTHVDEIHTINYGINTLLGRENITLRVGETTRWFARIIYPAAIYYMNSRMGGEHVVTGWDYAGAEYLKRHYHAPESVKKDPVLQDFNFAMKFLLGFFVIFSFAFAAFFIHKAYGVTSSLTYFCLGLSSHLVLETLSVFYTESSFIILFNLIVGISFFKNFGKVRTYLWLPLLFAAAISTKLTGVLFALPLLAIFINHEKNIFSGLKIEILAGMTFIFLVLINLPVGSFSELIDQTLSNVYHLKTGHFDTQPSGLYQLKEITKSLFPWSLLTPLSIFILIRYQEPNRLFALSCILLLGLMIAPLLGLAWFHERNLTTPLVVSILLSAIALKIFITRFSLRKGLNQKKISKGIVISAVLIFLIKNISQFKQNNAMSLSPLLNGCHSIGVIGTKEIPGIRTTPISLIPDSFIFKYEQENFLKRYQGFDCILVNSKGNTKHDTHYLLPQKYNLTGRRANNFVYKQK